jgi:hypothetical protein
MNFESLYEEAEQIVCDEWRDGNYILEADNFHGVTFEIV